MIVGDGFYIWSPLYFKPRNQENSRYFGNVIGNLSLEDQLSIIDEAGGSQKTDIQSLAEEEKIVIDALSEKFVRLWRIIDAVEERFIGIEPSSRSNDNSSFIQAFIDSYDSTSSGGSEISNPVADINPFSESGADFYTWHPNHFKIIASEYFGNIIGNIPTSEQIKIVADAGSKQKIEILVLGESEAKDISQRSDKYRMMMSINGNVMKNIITFFGGAFILDSSALDVTPLG